jgi:tetratricopeptide (TPR) repeat protein
VHTSIASAGDSGAGGVPVDEILEGLGALGLINPVPLGNEKALFVHPVIADTNRIYLREPGRSDPSPRLVLQTAVDLLAAALEDLAEDQPQDWPTFRVLAPHLQALITNSVPEPDEGDPRRLDEHHLDNLVRLAGHTAMAYRNMWLPEAGVELVTSALTHFGDGRETPTVLLARQQQANLLIQTGQAAEAERIYRDVLKAQLSIWPNDDLTNMIARYNLAASIGEQSRWADAEAIFHGVLDDERRMLGNNSFYTLSTRRGLITLACRQGAWAKAEGELRALLEDEKRMFGENNRSSLSTRFDLAQAIRHQNRDHEAKGIIRKLLRDAQELLGDDHPTTVTIREFHEGTLLVPQLFSTPDAHEEFGHILFDVAFTLDEQADSQESAVQAYQEFIDRFAGDPAPGLRELVAKALRRKAITLADLDRPQDALAAIEQAVALYQELAEANPAAHQTDLDSACKRLAQIKTQIGKTPQEPQIE